MSSGLSGSRLELAQKRGVSIADQLATVEALDVRPATFAERGPARFISAQVVNRVREGHGVAC